MSIEQKHQQLQTALSVIADYFRATQTQEIKLQSDDVVIGVKYGNTLDNLEMKCSQELLHHYHGLKCCPTKYFSIGSNENCISPKPKFCPFCGSAIEIEHKHTFATYVSERVKICVDCGKTEPLFDLEIKHQR